MTALPDWMRPPRAEGWFAEDEDSKPVVHVYELDGPTATYAPAGIFREHLHRPVPFEIKLDLGRMPGDLRL
jgi:hypothetical protein